MYRYQSGKAGKSLRAGWQEVAALAGEVIACFIVPASLRKRLSRAPVGVNLCISHGKRADKSL